MLAQQQIQTKVLEGNLLEQIAELTLEGLIRGSIETEQPSEGESSGNLAQHISDQFAKEFPRLNSLLFEEGKREEYIKIVSPSVGQSLDMWGRIQKDECFDGVLGRLWYCQTKPRCEYMYTHYSQVLRVHREDPDTVNEGFYLKIPVLMVLPFPGPSDLVLQCLGKEIYSFKNAFEGTNRISWHASHTKGLTGVFPTFKEAMQRALDNEMRIEEHRRNRDYNNEFTLGPANGTKVGPGRAEGTFTCTANIRIPKMPIDVEKQGFYAQQVCGRIYAEAVKQQAYQFQTPPSFKLYTLWAADSYNEFDKVEMNDFDLFEISYTVPQRRGVKGNILPEVVYTGIAYKNGYLSEPGWQIADRAARHIQPLYREIDTDGCPALILRIEQQPGVSKEHNHLIALWNEGTPADQKLKSMVRKGLMK